MPLGADDKGSGTELGRRRGEAEPVGGRYMLPLIGANPLAASSPALEEEGIDACGGLMDDRPGGPGSGGKEGAG